jgi:hypothetical protein
MEPTYETKTFHLGDILSITTHKLCSPHGIQGVYNILNFMLSANIFTHEIPWATDICAPELLRQFPQLANVSTDGLTEDTFQDWLAMQVAEHGMYHEVKSLGRVHDQ